MKIDRQAAEPTLSEKRAALSCARNWGCPADTRIEVIETHGAFVFLTPERAYKLVKDIALGETDYRTLAAREARCRAELRLNMPLAAGIYRRVLPLRRTPGGLRPGLGGGPVVDWLLEMVRLPDDALLDRRLATGGVTADEMRAVARHLARFCHGARRRPEAGAGYLAALRARAITDAHHLTMAGDTMAGDRAGIPLPGPAKLSEDALDLLAASRAEVVARAAAGLVVEGHGDLRAEHVCLGRPPAIFDRREGPVEVRICDLHDEVGFLGLECAMAGAPWIAGCLRAVLISEGLPAPSPRLHRAYGALALLTRARLAIDHLLDPRPRTPQKWPERARRHLLAAADVLAGADLGR